MNTHDQSQSLQSHDGRKLRAYVNSYSLLPGWTFLTGQKKEMELIRRKLGFFNSNPRIDADVENHTGMVRVGNDALDRWFMMPASAIRN